MRKPCILFVQEETRTLDYLQMPLHWQAAQAGFRSYAVSWRNLQTSLGHLSLTGGYQALSQGIKRYLLKPESCQPDVIFLRTYAEGACRQKMEELSKMFPNALLSWIPEWEALCRKWETERAVQLAAPDLPRPRSWLWESSEGTPNRILFEARHYIVKPSAASQCKGIRLFEADKLREGLCSLPEGRYVIQELLEEPLLFRGKRFDLRVNLGGNFQGGEAARIFQNIILRPAGKPWDDAKHPTPESILTGTSFRKRSQLNWVSHILENVETKENWTAEELKRKIENLVLRVMDSYRKVTFFNQAPNFDRFFYFSGMDLLPVWKDGEIELKFLETNYFPMITGWGKSIDENLAADFPQWLTWLYRLSQERGLHQRRSLSVG